MPLRAVLLYCKLIEIKAKPVSSQFLLRYFGETMQIVAHKGTHFIFLRPKVERSCALAAQAPTMTPDAQRRLIPLAGRDFAQAPEAGLACIRARRQQGVLFSG
jgi:hypothetical protein